MPKLIIVTLNPAIDNYIEVDTLKSGQVHRAKRSEQYAAGKGINVARTIACLKKQVHAFCVTGADEAAFFNQLASGYISITLYPVAGLTRSNFTIANVKRQQITHLQTQGFTLKRGQLKSFEDRLLEILTEGDIVVLSGSLPEGIAVNYYKTLIGMCRKKGCRVIFDSGGEAFVRGLEGVPYAVKPNLDELSDLSLLPLRSMKNIAEEAAKLNERGIEYVFVSLGKAGVIMTQRGKRGYLKARLKLPDAPKIQSDIGCGDAMVAGIAVSFSGNHSDETMLRLAVACGAANLFSRVPGMCDPGLVESLSQQVEIKRFK